MGEELRELREMAGIIMSQVDSLLRVAEFVEPRALLKLVGFEEKTAPVRERYVSSCSEVQEQLRTVLKRIQERSPEPELEARLSQAIDRLEELKKRYE